MIVLLEHKWRGECICMCVYVRVLNLWTLVCTLWQWCRAYGEKHLQTVKAITMIGLLKRKLHGEQAGIEWYRKELRIREELQGEVRHVYVCMFVYIYIYIYIYIYSLCHKHACLEMPLFE
jgi:hypothetical protein